MYTVFVTCKIKPGRGDDFAEAARRNREETRREPGNVRFDVLRAAGPSAPEQGTPELFYLWEVYHAPEDFAAHQKTPHYLRFRDEVAGLMAEPRQGLHGVPLHADPWE